LAGAKWVDLGACSSEGAIAPSCRAPQGHDQTREKYHFFSFFDLRQPQVDFFPNLRQDQLRTSSVAGGLIVDMQLPQVEKNSKIENSPWFDRDHVARGNAELKPLRRRAPDMSLDDWLTTKLKSLHVKQVACKLLACTDELLIIVYYSCFLLIK